MSRARHIYLTDTITAVPITITLPGPGPDFRVGPGCVISVVSDFVGPFPADSTWRIVVSLDNEGQQALWGATVPITNHTASVRWGDNTVSTQSQGQTAIPPNTNVFVVATVFQPGNVVVDSGFQPAIYDPVTTLWELSLIIQRGIGTGTGGLTPEQDQILHDTNQAVIQQIPAQNATHWAIDLGQFVTHPPVWFLDQLLTPLLLTGRGTLEIPQNPFLFNTYGLIPHFVTVPPAAGRRDGAIVRYNNRVVQFVAMNTTVQDTTRRYIGDFVEFDHDEQPWLWAQYQPVELLYDVTPGFGIGITWLFAGGSPPPGWPP